MSDESQSERSGRPEGKGKGFEESGFEPEPMKDYKNFNKLVSKAEQGNPNAMEDLAEVLLRWFKCSNNSWISANLLQSHITEIREDAPDEVTERYINLLQEELQNQ